MRYPRGLIRLTTENSLKNSWSGSKIFGHVVRPHVLIYSVILLALCIAIVVSMVIREPLMVDVIRDRASLAHIVSDGKLENVYRLQSMNAKEVAQKYGMNVKGAQDIEVVEGRWIDVDAAQTRGVAVRVQVPHGAVGEGTHTIEFKISAESRTGHIFEKPVFLVPS